MMWEPDDLPHHPGPDAYFGDPEEDEPLAPSLMERAWPYYVYLLVFLAGALVGSQVGR